METQIPLVPEVVNSQVNSSKKSRRGLLIGLGLFVIVGLVVAVVTLLAVNVELNNRARAQANNTQPAPAPTPNPIAVGEPNPAASGELPLSPANPPAKLVEFVLPTDPKIAFTYPDDWKLEYYSQDDLTTKSLGIKSEHNGASDYIPDANYQFKISKDGVSLIIAADLANDYFGRFCTNDTTLYTVVSDKYLRTSGAHPNIVRNSGYKYAYVLNLGANDFGLKSQDALNNNKWEVLDLSKPGVTEFTMCSNTGNFVGSYKELFNKNEFTRGVLAHTIIVNSDSEVSEQVIGEIDEVVKSLSLKPQLTPKDSEFDCNINGKQYEKYEDIPTKNGVSCVCSNQYQLVCDGIAVL